MVMIYDTIPEEKFKELQQEKYGKVSAKRISVVMPFFNNWKLTHQRLMELHKHVYFYEIVLVNDASTEAGINTSVAWWQKEAKLPIKYIKNEKNLGFGKSMNKGIWSSDGEVVVLLSNDVVVSGDFSVPVLSSVDTNVLVGNTLYDWNTGWNAFDLGELAQFRIFPYLGGYFLAAYKESFVELGGFDDRYGKFDYEDVDISTKALYLGYNLVPLNSPYLRHMSGQTVRKAFPDREKYTMENREKFYKKWKEIYENSSEFPNNI